MQPTDLYLKMTTNKDTKQVFTNLWKLQYHPVPHDHKVRKGPNTYMTAITPLCNSSFRIADAPFWPPQLVHNTTALTEMQMNNQTQENKFLLSWQVQGLLWKKTRDVYESQRRCTTRRKCLPETVDQLLIGTHSSGDSMNKSYSSSKEKKIPALSWESA